MNTTNTTFAALEAQVLEEHNEFELQFVVFFHETWITGLVSVLQFALLAVILFRGKSRTRKTLFTPLNILLAFMILSNCLNLTCFFFSGLVHDAVPLSVLNIALTKAFVVTVFMYNYYRVFPIMKTYAPRALYGLQAVVFVVIPLLQIIQIALILCQFFVANYFTIFSFVNVLFIIVAVFAFLSEIVVTGSYIAHLFADPGLYEVEVAYTIIAKFGVASSLIVLLWQASDIASNNGNWDLITWLYLQSFYILSPLVFTSLQVWMKWEILKAQETRQRLGTSPKMSDLPNLPPLDLSVSATVLHAKTNSVVREGKQGKL
ncbi:hypothetical protein BC830DRAFT_1146773 [Chytriomyces sp. MP71]|nr:hypothetical protein BC830DRAFT_1146773 [Chytriomyces sp. MP71]